MAGLDASDTGYPNGYLAEVGAFAEQLVRSGVNDDSLSVLVGTANDELERGAEIRSTIELDIESTDVREIAEFQRLIAFAFDTAVVAVHGAEGLDGDRFREVQVAGILAEYAVTLRLVETSIGSWHGVIEVVTSRSREALKYVALAGAVLSVIGAAAPGIGIPLLVIGAVLSGVPALAAVIPGLNGLKFRGKSVRAPRAAATVRLRTEFLYHYVLACEPGTEDKAINKFRAHLLLDADDLGIDKSSFRTTQQEDEGSLKHIQFTTSKLLTYDELDVVDDYLEKAKVPAFWVQRPQPPATGTPKS